jgi:hypothetical protein
VALRFALHPRSDPPGDSIEDQQSFSYPPGLFLVAQSGRALIAHTALVKRERLKRPGQVPREPRVSTAGSRLPP